MISVRQAREIILKNIFPVKENELIKIESALGRVCVSDLKSKENIPPFDNSAMDGFAVRSEDLKGSTRKSPKILEVVGSLAAGYTTGKTIRQGEAIRIMTGAPLPKGADSVVMVEDTQKVTTSPRHQVTSKKEYVRIFKEGKKGENVR